MSSIEKVGIVAMPRISVGGGFARATRDLIAALNSMGKEVHLLTPFSVDLNKIAELYGPIKLESVRHPHKAKTFFSRDEILGRKLMKNEFKQLARDVDFIIDLDGCVLHKYLPKEFDRNNYVIWRLSCINPETYKIQGVRDPKVLAKMLIKRTVKKLITLEKDIPREFKIYPVDEWTRREIIRFWRVQPEKMCLYPDIKVAEFDSSKKKVDQIVILGRIASNKSIHESIEIFCEGTKNHSNYKLIIIGGITPDSHQYIAFLRKRIADLSIKNRVLIVPDPSFSKIKDVLAHSKIIIDSQRGTSMNMPVVEALASGCVALMQKNSGTYLEVLDNGKYGYGFENIKDGSRALNEIISKDKFDTKKSIERAEFFSSNNFKSRLNRILSASKT